MYPVQTLLVFGECALLPCGSPGLASMHHPFARRCNVNIRPKTSCYTSKGTIVDGMVCGALYAKRVGLRLDNTTACHYAINLALSTFSIVCPPVPDRLYPPDLSRRVYTSNACLMGLPAPGTSSRCLPRPRLPYHRRRHGSQSWF